MGANRDNENKPPISIVPKAMVEGIAEVMMFGKKKYGMHNWRQGGKKLSSHSIMDSALRHIFKYLDGEDVDEESGLCHISHAACNLAFLKQLTSDNKLVDDRYKEEVLRSMEEYKSLIRDSIKEYDG